MKETQQGATPWEAPCPEVNSLCASGIFSPQKGVLTWAAKGPGDRTLPGTLRVKGQEGGWPQPGCEK